jgi:hypothetical protein
MTWLLLFCGLLLSSMRGISEAVVWHFPAPRNHPLVWWYHWSRRIEFVSLLAIVLIIERLPFNIWLFSGLFIFCWEQFEVAYLVSRLGQADDHENLLGLISIDGHTAVLTLHILRFLAGGALIIGGMV